MAKNTAPSFHDISSQLTIAAALNILSFEPPHPSLSPNFGGEGGVRGKLDTKE